MMKLCKFVSSVGGGGGGGIGGSGGDDYHPQMRTYSIVISPCQICIVTHVILELRQQDTSCYFSKIHQNLYYHPCYNSIVK